MTTKDANHRKCLACGMAFRILTRDGAIARSGALHGVDPDGHFCTLNCAARFGASAVKAGYHPGDLIRRRIKS